MMCCHLYPPPPDGLVIARSTGVGDVISVPQYDDSNFYDTIEKALDITEWAHMGVGVSEVELPALVEGGLIAATAVVGVVGPLVALGSGWNEALRERSLNAHGPDSHAPCEPGILKGTHPSDWVH
jgi:hypothetical protein